MLQMDRGHFPPVAHFGRTTRAPAEIGAQPPGGIERHLILVYRSGWQSPEDLNAIAAIVRELDPSIAVSVISANGRGVITRRAAAGHPTLVVSAGKIPTFAPTRGKILQGRPLAKLREVDRLIAAGVPVPRTAELTPDLELDPAEWGEFVILKPTDINTSSFGRGVQLMRTTRVRYRPPEEYPEGHPGRRGPMIAQTYVDTGNPPGVFRVLTFLGRPMYAYFIRGDGYGVDLSAPDDVIENAVVASQAYDHAERTFVEDRDVLDAAAAADAAMPDIPLKGCDIVRDAKTGKAYVLEVNAGGNTWHFSSHYFREYRQKLGPEFVRKMHTQFDAFRSAAEALVARTRAEAE
jgi:hypothetical protein